MTKDQTENTPEPDDDVETPPEGETKVGKTYSEDDIKAVRKEAANYRTRLRDVEKERDDHKTALENLRSESSAALVTASTATAEALKYRVAVEKGLPAPLAHRLVGTTREELEADAATLASLAPAGSTTFDQGKTDGPPATVGVNDAIRRLRRS